MEAFVVSVSINALCGKLEAGIDYNGDDLKMLHLHVPGQWYDAFKAFVDFSFYGMPTASEKTTGMRQTTVTAVSATISVLGYAWKEWEVCGNPTMGTQCCPNNDNCQP